MHCKTWSGKLQNGQGRVVLLPHFAFRILLSALHIPHFRILPIPHRRTRLGGQRRLKQYSAKIQVHNRQINRSRVWVIYLFNRYCSGGFYQYRQPGRYPLGTKIPVTVPHVLATTLSPWLLTVFWNKRNMVSKITNIPTLISFGSNLGGISWMALDELSRRTTR